jgi:hypothetical protein
MIGENSKKKERRKEVLSLYAARRIFLLVRLVCSLAVGVRGEVK